jgi:FlaA1/EpsC-like NDP-sugar epimerase
MIRLKGLTIRDAATPDGDIEIELTGLMPGEKLHEELLIADAASGTEHPKIMRAEERFLSWAELRGALNTIEQACDGFDFDAIKTFVERLVEGADLSAELADLTGQRVSAQVVKLRD